MSIQPAKAATKKDDDEDDSPTDEPARQRAQLMCPATAQCSHPLAGAGGFARDTRKGVGSVIQAHRSVLSHEVKPDTSMAPSQPSRA